MPGTGKTATVMEMLNQMRSEARQGGDLQFLAINCLQLPSAQHVYSKVGWWKAQVATAEGLDLDYDVYFL